MAIGEENRPYKPDIQYTSVTITCACGERLNLGHPERGPFLCTKCRRWWTVKVHVSWEHEYQRNPTAAVRMMGQAIRAVQSGRQLDEALYGYGIESILAGLEDEGYIPPVSPAEEPANG